ncbi:MAG: chemotaxis protein CheW [Gammaproteobacteria bacterium]|nr:chemotaxis protein CheW [Gammaproteobacteria bacterium]
MKGKKNNNQSSEALDDYLNVLLDSEEMMACEQKDVKSVPLSGSKLYQFDSHPSRKQSSVENEEPEVRNNIERVERLLDDFNCRQQVEMTEEPVIEKSAETLVSESTVLLQPTVLQPETIIKEEQEYIELEEVVVEVNEEVQVSNLIHEDRVFEREDWSEKPFQTLLFDVGGLTLALPLIKLGGIHRIDADITPLFGKPDWFMGLTPGIEGNINVVDTARWVMPDKYQQAEEAGLDYEFVILLADSNWGIACSAVQNAISLSPDNIRWRATAGKRPWLAGMLIDEMCALLDVDTLINLLEANFPR